MSLAVIVGALELQKLVQLFCRGQPYRTLQMREESLWG